MNDPVKQLSLYNLILEEGLSVRKVESIVKGLEEGISIEQLNGAGSKKNKTTKTSATQQLSDDFDALKQHLSSYFQTDVQFSCNKRGKGKITIPFDSTEDLERLIVMFDKMQK
jgi:ParB family chromosome partitioning protein